MTSPTEASSAPSQHFALDASLRILFLTTYNYSAVPPAIPSTNRVQNSLLAQRLHELGASVHFASWRSAACTPAYLSQFSAITFLCCDEYAPHVGAFRHFLASTLHDAQTLNPHLRVANTPSLVAWNADKTYLLDLQAAGLPLPRTAVVAPNDEAALAAALRDVPLTLAGQPQPLVLKPSASASGNFVHLLANPALLSRHDRDQIRAIGRACEDNGSGGIVVQRFEQSVRTVGEFSLVFVRGLFELAALKRPNGEGGEYRVNEQYGGQEQQIGRAELPLGALDVAGRVVVWLAERFGGDEKKPPAYVRVDGMVETGGESRGFVLVEVECVEPDIWLTGGLRGGDEDSEGRVKRFVSGLFA